MALAAGMKKTIIILFYSLCSLTLWGQYLKETEPEPRGFRAITTADNMFSLWVDGFLHLDGGIFYLYYEDYDHIPNGGAVRNARLALKTEIANDWFGMLEVDFSNLKPRITEAYITYSGIKNLQVEADTLKNYFPWKEPACPGNRHSWNALWLWRPWSRWICWLFRCGPTNTGSWEPWEDLLTKRVI
jgi:hypothetical protein